LNFLWGGASIYVFPRVLALPRPLATTAKPNCHTSRDHRAGDAWPVSGFTLPFHTPQQCQGSCRRGKYSLSLTYAHLCSPTLTHPHQPKSARPINSPVRGSISGPGHRGRNGLPRRCCSWVFTAQEDKSTLHITLNSLSHLRSHFFSFNTLSLALRCRSRSLYVSTYYANLEDLCGELGVQADRGVFVPYLSTCRLLECRASSG
jgi:hypothetical protein